MRVEGQRMATEFPPIKREGVKPNKEDNSNGEKEKISLKELKSEENYSPKVIQDAVNTANNAIKITNYHLQFRLHEESGRYSVKVIDSTTDEVIREIPPENVLEFSASIRKMLNDAVGVLVDEVV